MSGQQKTRTLFSVPLAVEVHHFHSFSGRSSTHAGASLARKVGKYWNFRRAGTE
jgi:hypothetical protein